MTLPSGLYLALMLGTIALLVAVIVPVILFKRCGHCGRRNGLDAAQCRKCGQPFPPG